MLKIPQARLQQYMNHALPDVQAGFRKGKEPEIKSPIFTEIEKAREFQKNICFIDNAEVFDYGLRQTVEALREMGIQTILPVS